VGNSNVALQDVVDGVSTIGDLSPVLLNTGGYAAEPALTISNDVASEMFAERFPWKWNRMKVPPFLTIPRQQDYCSINLLNVGWLENGFRVDINNTQIPPYTERITVVRDLAVANVYAGWPEQACWFPNDQLEQWVWPGPNKTFTNPVGVPQTPTNPITNILDANGNILILTQWGITGPVAPVSVYPPIDPLDPLGPVDYDADITGQVIVDGTCKWTVANPSAAGIRLSPAPANGANTWLVRLFAQKKAPVFTTLADKLDPIPDDQVKWFRDGFICYAHRHSANPAVRQRYPQMKADWLNSMEAATKQADRESESKGFYPAHALVAPGRFADLGPGNPYMRSGGRR
jgi:hypothetical protein